MSKPHTQTCPVAHFLNVFGDSWTWMIVREAFYGATRFDEFRRNTGIARNILSDRLSVLVATGILERRDIGQTGPRFAYHMTPKGRSLLPVLVTMVQWSNDNLFEAGQVPVLLVERESGKPLSPVRPMTSDNCPLDWNDLGVRPGPGASRAAKARLADIARASGTTSRSE